MFKKFLDFCVKHTTVFIAVQEQLLACEKENSIKKETIKEYELLVKKIKKDVRKIYKLVKNIDELKEAKKLCNVILRGDRKWL